MVLTDMSNKVITISLPIELINKLEKSRGDLPRSLVYRRVLEKGLN